MTSSFPAAPANRPIPSPDPGTGPDARPGLGVAVVAFNSADVLIECLESLMAAQGVALHVAVIDNASTDDTLTVLRDWAAGTVAFVPDPALPVALSPCAKPVSLEAPSRGAAHPPPHPSGHRITLIRSQVNLGFAGGVNLGLAHLAKDITFDRFWVLNPDSIAGPDTARAFAAATPGPFSLMGGRVIYLETPDRIQIDGGLVNARTGVTGNIHLGAPADMPAPDPAAMDFITGASMVASRAFYEKTGPMREDYFLYYEEVDWAFRRGDLPLAYCAGATVYHRAGTSIGSPTLDRIASPFSLYFKHRGRARFIRRHLPGALPTAWAWSLAKAAQYALKGHLPEARALLAGMRDAPPPQAVRDRFPPENRALAFAPFVK